jgi:F0F1-type ATP synthase assembly protein I
MTDPGGQKPRDPDGTGLTNLADAYRKAAPYTAASTSLVVAVGGCTWLGHLADGWFGLGTPWLTVAGAVLGMVVGFISFFRQVLGPRKHT